MHHRKIKGKDKYVFKRYNSIYRQAFKKERVRLYDGLGHENVAIEHVGSTAVPGLGGKNILDIIVGLKKGKRLAIKKKIQKLGYDFVGTAGSRRRLFFVRDSTYRHKSIRIHLHLVKFGGEEWQQKIAFRDYLIGHREAVLEYESVKKIAVKEAKGNKERYLKAKEKFINSITKKALKNYNTVSQRFLHKAQ
ncbi:MAG: GrpB family protein [Candidatus Micrarchaeia archaeon]